MHSKEKCDLSSTERTHAIEGVLQSLLYENFFKIHSSTRMCYASSKRIQNNENPFSENTL